MSLQVVGIVATAEAPQLGLRVSIIDPRLSVIRGSSLSMVVCEGEAPDPRDAARWIVALHEAMDVLPMRFGDRLESAAEAEEILARRGSQLALALDGIRGRTEFGARLPAPPAEAPTRAPQGAAAGAPAPEAASGLAFLRARAAHYAAADGIPAGLTARVQAWVAAMAMPDVRARLEGPSRLIASPGVFFLVPRARSGVFLERFEQVRGVIGVPAVLTGPWPPFNFVRAVDAAG